MSDPPEKNEKAQLQLNDRVLFTVGFLALFLALAPFKDELSSYSITYFYVKFSLYNSLLIVAAFLFFSVYANAIENLKNIKLCSNWKFLTFFGSIADYLYFFAIFGCPLLIIAVFAIFFLINLALSSVLNVEAISLISSVISTISLLITIFYDLYKEKKKRNETAETSE